MELSVVRNNKGEVVYKVKKNSLSNEGFEWIPKRAFEQRSLYGTMSGTICSGNGPTPGWAGDGRSLISSEKVWSHKAAQGSSKNSQEKWDLQVQSFLI